MKKKKVYIIILICAIGLLLLLSYPTWSKYVTDRITSYYLKSKNFFFSSNLLDTNNTEYQIGTWSGVGSFNISFDLYSMDNELLFSESDIAYEIVVDSGCSSETEDVTCTVASPTGTLYANSQDHTETISVNVNPSRVFLADERLTVDIIARSTAPYKKTLSARFVYIVGREGVSYKIEDEANSTYLLLKITNDINYCTVIEDFGNYTVGKVLSDTEYRDLDPLDRDKCISQYINVTFDPDDLLLDNTSTIMDIATYDTTTISGIDYIDELEFAISPNSTVAIKFYKQDITANNTYPHGNNSSIVNVVATSPVVQTEP